MWLASTNARMNFNVEFEQQIKASSKKGLNVQSDNLAGQSTRMFFDAKKVRFNIMLKNALSRIPDWVGPEDRPNSLFVGSI